MGIKIKNLQTGEFEKFNIPALKGEKGEPGEIEPSEKVDYIGKQHSKLRDTMNANVDYIIKTAIGEFNYLDYEGQQITATNTLEGHAKSAILSGRTEATGYSYNGYMLNNHSILSATGEITTMGVNGWSATDSLIKLESGEYYIEDDGTSGDGYTYVYFYTENGVYLNSKSRIDVGVANRFNIDELSYVKLSRRKTLVNKLKIYRKEDLKLLSVKMPVLTTTGKNLFDGMLEQGWLGDSSGNPNTAGDGVHSPNYIRVNPSTTYICSWKTKPSSSVFKAYFYDKNKTFLKQSKQSSVFTTPDDCYYVRFRFYGGSAKPSDFENIQIEEGTTITSFESYKSNILTVNEEVELRGIGDVKDTLDCLTGEITHYIKDGLLDGTETWTAIFNSNSSVFSTTSFNIVVGSEIIYDKLPDGVNNITNNNGVLKVSTTSEFASIAVSNFIKKLKENPIPFMYCSNDVVIKTVDLSDNVVYSYGSTTHYSCSSEEGSLVPTLSVKVPTDTQLTIQEQKATTQTLLIKNMDLQQSIKEVQAMNLAFNTALYNSFNSIREEVEDIKKHVSTNENLEGSF